MSGELIKPHLMIVFTGLLITGCVISNPPPKESERIVVQYQCDNGEQVEMRYFPEQEVAVLVRHGRAIELQQQRSASGFWYSNGPNTVRGKGDELTVEIGRMVPLRCNAI